MSDPNPARRIVLDTGVLSLLTLRVGVPKGDDCKAWLAGLLRSGRAAHVPEVADYELRRELTRAGKTAGLARLDAFNALPGRYLPLTTPAMRRAAELWAQVRNQGRPTAPDEDIDGDVILSAQALTQGWLPADVIVATPNTKHIGRFLTARRWEDIR